MHDNRWEGEKEEKEKEDKSKTEVKTKKKKTEENRKPPSAEKVRLKDEALITGSLINFTLHLFSGAGEE